MVNSAKLSVPLLAADQSQKHVTHNEALLTFDQLVQQTVINRTTSTPPGSPSDGDAYIVAASPTGTWTGQVSKVAAWIFGAWYFFTPREGWIVYDETTDEHLKWNGASWVSIFATGGDSWGWQNFQHTGASVTLTSAGTWYPLINDAAGALTSTAYAVTGHGSIWDTSTNRIDLSSLSIGDRVHCRIDLTPTTTTVNTALSCRLILQEGLLNVPIGCGAPAYYKSAGTQDSIVFEPTITVFNANTRDYPVRVEVKADTAGSSVVISGFTFETRVR